MSLGGRRRKDASLARKRAALKIVILGLFLAGALRAQPSEPAASPLVRGDYRQEIERLEKQRQSATESSSLDLGLDRQLAQALNRIGEWDRTLELFEEAAGQGPAARAALGLPVAVALAARGEDEKAQVLFDLVIASGGVDAMSAMVESGELFLRSGQRDQAEDLFYRLIDAYNARARLSSQELVAVGRACWHLGRNDPQLFKDALKAFDEAATTDPNEVPPRALRALLFVEKYDSGNAREAAADALGLNEQDPLALYAMARVLHFDGSPEALPLVEKSLGIAPGLVAPRVFLAQLRLELEEHETAEKEARLAVEVNPRSLEALSVLAAAQYLRHDQSGYLATRKKVLTQNPTYAGLFVRLAESCVQNRLYQQARDFAAEGVALDPKSWQTLGELGLNQLRLGEIEEGRKNLEVAFAGDPYNVWNKNTLDLLDTFGDYRLSRHGRFDLFIHKDEAEVLAPYIGALAEEAYQALAERYGHSPPTPIRIEVYPSHEDFSVRTVGLAGLGALGVAFGRVLAIDSPSAREVGHFNWGSTLWHELTHTFTLGVTEHRIPRWLTEGLSVLEERRARPGWGDDVRPEFLQALRDGKLLGVAEINNGFVRPTFPIQIGLSYYQASLLCELLEREYGFDSIRRLLEGYRQGKDTPELFAEVFGLSLDELDKKYFGYLEKRFALALPSFVAQTGSDHPPMGGSPPGKEDNGKEDNGKEDNGKEDEREEGENEDDDEDGDEPSGEIQIGVEAARDLLAQGEPSDEELEKAAKKKPDDFRAQLAWGGRLFGQNEYDAALPFLERAKTLFPEYVGGGNPYVKLAKIRRKAGDLAGAAAELDALVQHNETAFAEHRELAELLGELGRKREEAAILDRTIYIYPMEPDVHRELATLYRELGEHDARARELRAVVALDPPSRAEALYELASALAEAGDRAAAKREVLNALELAPGYDQAQKLLLELAADPSGAGSSP